MMKYIDSSVLTYYAQVDSHFASTSRYLWKGGSNSSDGRSSGVR